MAETTTMGRRRSWFLTMDVTRVMASRDSTEVPPNFMTIMGWRSELEGLTGRSAADQEVCPTSGRGWKAAKKTLLFFSSLVEKSFRGHELGVEDGGAGGAANGIVAAGD